MMVFESLLSRYAISIQLGSYCIKQDIHQVDRLQIMNLELCFKVFALKLESES